jgi:DNA-binding NarL/FixJ family response regulator
MIRVLIADDQALVRTGFRVMLEVQPDLEVVGEARDGREAIASARALRPHVVLMDIRMPALDGIEATRRIVQEQSLPRVLILTTFDLDEYVYEALRAGASGFLLKDAGREELIHAVRVVAAGEALLSPTITRRLIEDYARRPRAHDRPDALTDLTPRELEVLRLIARGRSHKVIARELGMAEKTVKTHVSHLLAKLGLADRTQAAVYAVREGLADPAA